MSSPFSLCVSLFYILGLFPSHTHTPALSFALCFAFTSAYVMVASWALLTLIGIVVQFATGQREDSKVRLL